MATPNQNPTPCGGASVGCCGNRVPYALVATFSGANVCGFSAGPYSLLWNGSTWTSDKCGCNSQETITLSCGGTSSADFTLSIIGVSGCVYSRTLTSNQCDPFRLVFSVTQNGISPNSCSCCSNGTVFTVTIEPAM